MISCHEFSDGLSNSKNQETSRHNACRRLQSRISKNLQKQSSTDFDRIESDHQFHFSPLNNTLDPGFETDQ